MSFSERVKAELAVDHDAPRHCCIAELSAIISMCGYVAFDENDKVTLKIQYESDLLSQKLFTLLEKTYNIKTDISIRRNSNSNKNRTCVLILDNDEKARKILMACRLMKPFGVIEEDFSLTDGLIVQQECCKRAFIRGAFLSSGSVSDPAKAYHFEIVCLSEAKARQLQSIIHSFDINAKVISRKKYYVVYVKEGSQVVDLLNIMGAYTALLEMENIRIVKEMRNEVNRKVNCETANIHKTVSAAMKQIEDINYIKALGYFDELPDALREIAELRTEYPEASLAELGEMLIIPVGKSGVNHRLKKINIFAEELRNRHNNQGMSMEGEV
jgi:DNA-binding protein WhiA